MVRKAAFKVTNVQAIYFSIKQYNIKYYVAVKASEATLSLYAEHSQHHSEGY